MGCCSSGEYRSRRIVILGLDGAGKTTILHNLKHGEVVTTVPTIGFNVEELHYKGLNLTTFDVGGQSKIRGLWQHYYQGCEGVIFVIDSSDTERMTECQGSVFDELRNVLREPKLQNVPFLLFANKQDVLGALDSDQLSEILRMEEITEHKWDIQECNALKGEGLFKGLDWLSAEIKRPQ